MRPTGCLSTSLLTFLATLAFIIGWRLPEETRVIAAGVLTGVAASVPTSLLVSATVTRALLARHAAAQATAEANPPPDPEPQIIVVPSQPAAPAQPGLPGHPPSRRAAPTTYTNDLPAAPRFTIIGGAGPDD